MQNDGLTESIERQAFLAWFEAASQLGVPGYDWKLEEIGDALCSVSVSEPSILFNRVLGLGLRDTPTSEQLDEINRLYREAGVSRFFLHIVPKIMSPEMDTLLVGSGFRRYRGWMKFARSPGGVDPVTTDLTIRRIGPDDAATIAAPAFDIALPASRLSRRWHTTRTGDFT